MQTKPDEPLTTPIKSSPDENRSSPLTSGEGLGVRAVLQVRLGGRRRARRARAAVHGRGDRLRRHGRRLTGRQRVRGRVLQRRLGARVQVLVQLRLADALVQTGGDVLQGRLRSFTL